MLTVSFLIAKVNFGGIAQHDSITDEFCRSTKGLFGDYNDHEELGGLVKMGEAMKRGMVLVMSLWDDHDANMVSLKKPEISERLAFKLLPS